MLHVLLSASALNSSVIACCHTAWDWASWNDLGSCTSKMEVKKARWSEDNLSYDKTLETECLTIYVTYSCNMGGGWRVLWDILLGTSSPWITGASILGWRTSGVGHAPRRSAAVVEGDWSTMGWTLISGTSGTYCGKEHTFWS